MDPETDGPGAASVRREERILKGGVLAFAVVLLATFTASIHLSTLGLRFGTLLFGSPVAWAGHTSCFRLAALDPQTMRQLPDLRADLELLSGPDQTPVWAAEASSPAPVLPFCITLPEGLAAPVTLVADLEVEGATDRIEAQLRLLDAPGVPQARFIPWTNQLSQSKDGKRALATNPAGWAISIYPDQHRILSGMPNRVRGRLLLDHAPAAGIEIVSKQLGLDAITDEMGLFTAKVRPTLRPKELVFSIREASDKEREGATPEARVEQSVKLPIELTAAPIALDGWPLGTADVGGNLTITINSLPFRDPIFVDLWAGNALVESRILLNNREQTLSLDLPPGFTGWVRAEVYRNAIAPGGDTAVHWLWVGPAPQWKSALSSFEGDDVLRKVVGEAAPESAIKLLPLLLSRLRPTAPGMAMLRSNLEAGRDRVEAQVSRLRGHVHRLFALTVLLGAALLLGWILRHQLKIRREVRSVLEEGVLEGEAIEIEDLDKLARWRQLYDFGVALAALGLAFYGLWTILTRIKWDWFAP